VADDRPHPAADDDDARARPAAAAGGALSERFGGRVFGGLRFTPQLCRRSDDRDIGCS
jgi:hypothetical protein